MADAAGNWNIYLFSGLPRQIPSKSEPNTEAAGSEHPKARQTEQCASNQPRDHFQPLDAAEVDDALGRPAPAVERDQIVRAHLERVVLRLVVDPRRVAGKEHVVELQAADWRAAAARLQTRRDRRRADGPSRRASQRASSSTRPPRAVLIKTEPGFMRASDLALIRCCVSGVSGECSET